MPPGVVRTERDVPGHRESGDTAVVRRLVDTGPYAEPLEQCLIRFEPGRSLPRAAARADELLYVISGRGALLVEGERADLGPDTACLVEAGESWAVDNPGPDPLVASVVRVPAPPGPAGAAMAAPCGPRRRTAVLGERERGAATADREFEILFEPANGCRGATAFVGFIPPAGAPEHYHLYDEICLILRGTGRLRVDGRAMPLSPGSCFHIAPRLLHAVENLGDADLCLLGVFRPAGDPSAAYVPDERGGTDGR